MKDKEIIIPQAVYVNEFKRMLQEAFEDTCYDDKAREAFRQAAIEALQTTPRLNIPKEAPELYADRDPRPELGNKKENPFEFFYRVYKPFLGLGLTNSDIKILDKQLYRALKNADQSLKPSDFDEVLPQTNKQTGDQYRKSALKTLEEKREITRRSNERKKSLP